MNLIRKCSLVEQNAMWNKSFSLIHTVQVNGILAYRNMSKKDWIDYLLILIGGNIAQEVERLFIFVEHKMRGR